MKLVSIMGLVALMYIPPVQAKQGYTVPHWANNQVCNESKVIDKIRAIYKLEHTIDIQSYVGRPSGSVKQTPSVMAVSNTGTWAIIADSPTVAGDKCLLAFGEGFKK